MLKSQTKKIAWFIGLWAAGVFSLSIIGMLIKAVL